MKIHSTFLYFFKNIKKINDIPIILIMVIYSEIWISKTKPLFSPFSHYFPFYTRFLFGHSLPCLTVYYYAVIVLYGKKSTEYKECLKLNVRSEKKNYSCLPLVVKLCHRVYHNYLVEVIHYQRCRVNNKCCWSCLL